MHEKETWGEWGGPQKDDQSNTSESDDLNLKIKTLEIKSTKKLGFFCWCCRSLTCCCNRVILYCMYQSSSEKKRWKKTDCRRSGIRRKIWRSNDRFLINRFDWYISWLHSSQTSWFIAFVVRNSLSQNFECDSCYKYV